MKRDLTRVVTWVLEQYEETRSDDFKLIMQVLEYYHRRNTLFGNYTTMTVSWIANGKRLGLPSFESITRYRRKIQEKRMDLCDPVMVAQRLKEQAEYEKMFGHINENMD